MVEVGSCGPEVALLCAKSRVPEARVPRWEHATVPYTPVLGCSTATAIPSLPYIPYHAIETTPHSTHLHNVHA